ncbi:MAG TPA: glycosyl hydrolase [Leucothrix mucor]|uniref:Glycosyl hydrolase n=1 Tax=Leucothrix mucor TaxID=45248 RepID=A0A7V2WVF0_LEUMU|nr:glycosyl hydrolase [Leucothrix mucor]
MPLRWDSFSDQPEMIQDKAYKHKIYKTVAWDFVKMVVTNLLIFPLASIFYLLIPNKKKTLDCASFFGMSINLDKNPEATRQLIDDLAVDNLLIRLPLHDIENLTDYIEFAQPYADKDLLINILQDRRHVEDHQRLRHSLDTIFYHFTPLAHRFQIGNAINRKKWAIFSMDEYLRFYKVAYDLKQQKYPQLILLGSAVIDFEYYFTIRTLFNFYRLHFDQLSSLLYVDRRGAPENTQASLDLIKKLHLLQSIARLSPKTSTEIVITETNWPIENTAPYAPTSEEECVSLEEHANYLVRYYILALASGVVSHVYWHQLIAAGYGLVDNRNGLNKYPAYYAFKTLLSVLKKAQFIGLEECQGLYHARFQGNKKIGVYWALQPATLTTKGKKIILRDGVELSQDEMLVGESPFYIIEPTVI